MKHTKSKKALHLGLILLLTGSLLLTSATVLAQETKPEEEPLPEAPPEEEPAPEAPGEPPEAPDEREVEVKADKKWTFMVYMAADNNLEGAAINDFLEMASVGSNNYVNIVVLMDRIPGYDSRYGDWEDTRYFYITKNMTPDAANGWGVGEMNMGNGANLKWFINATKALFPAEKYALVIWDHGNGFQPRGDDLSERGVAWDDSSGINDYLNNKELSNYLSQATGGGADKLDVLGFDACLMAQMEVHQHVKKYARYGVGSEKTEPYNGWPYDKILAWLRYHYNADGRYFSNLIAYHYYVSYGFDETQSAVDYGTRYNTVISNLNNFANKMIAEINSNPSFRDTIASARGAAIKMDSNGDFIDLSDFASAIISRTRYGTPVNMAARQLREAVRQMVVVNKAGPFYRRSRGVTIFLPHNQSTWNTWAASYQTNQFLARDTRWNEFLDTYY